MVLKKLAKIGGYVPLMYTKHVLESLNYNTNI